LNMRPCRHFIAMDAQQIPSDKNKENGGHAVKSRRLITNAS
jgi:hypothetical protein